MYRPSTSSSASVSLPIHQHDVQCPESYDYEASHGTFSSSLTDLETSDDDESATQSKFPENHRAGSSAASCRSTLSEDFETLVDEPCRSLSSYIRSMYDDGEVYVNEWHELITSACPAGGAHDRRRTIFPISKMRTVCTDNTDDAHTSDTEPRPLSDLETIQSPLWQLARYAYPELLATHVQSNPSPDTLNRFGHHWEETSISPAPLIGDSEAESGPSSTTTSIRTCPSRVSADAVHVQVVIPDHNIEIDTFDTSINLSLPESSSACFKDTTDKYR